MFLSTMFQLIILVALLTANADYGDQISTAYSALNDDTTGICNQLKDQFQTSYSVMLCKLAVSNGIFDKLYNASMNSDDAANTFYNSALFFAESLGLPHESSIHLNVSDAARYAFSNEIAPMNYFKIFQRTMEDYMIKEGLLTEKNSFNLAEKHFRALEKSLKVFELDENPFAMTLALTDGNTSFLNSFGKMPREDIEYMMRSFKNIMEETVTS